MAAYYNEFDKNKAAWLRELIKAGAIADGEVDERSIADVTASDVVRFTQCHWFAGIGVWSHALRLAGWPDDEPCWTASCPCQGFSVAGKKKGFADRRHLWPECFRLIDVRRPVVLFGEQVQSPDGLAWLDLVSTDLEGSSYTVGATGLCAAGIGSPHLRNRLFFMADGMRTGRAERGSESGIGSSAGMRREGIGARPNEAPGGRSRSGPSGRSSIGLMGNPNEERPQGRIIGRNGTNECAAGAAGVVSGMGNATGIERGAGRIAESGGCSDQGERGESGSEPGTSGTTGGMGDTEGSNGCLPVFKRGSFESSPQSGGTSGPCNGFWSDARWIYCRDDAWRPAQPATLGMADELAGDLGYLRLPGDGSDEGREVFFPLIQKGKARTQRLRGYGDGIVAELAAEFIRCCIEERDLRKPSALRGK